MIKDPYIQENGILKNKLGITEYDTLNLAEKDITFSKFLNVENVFPTNFDSNYLKLIHKYIFGDVFDWAGSFRTVSIYKEEIVIPGLSLNYVEPQNIEQEIKNCMEVLNSIDWNSLSLKDKSSIFTKNLTTLWRIHPFRDGNTRTTLTFAKQFSKEHGFPMDLASLLDNLSRKTDANGRITQFSIRDKFVLAAIPKEYCPEPQHLNSLIYDSIVTGISKQISNLNNTLTSAKNNDENCK